MFIEIIIIYAVYLVAMTCVSYYINLFMSKEEFTKEELKHILPYLVQYWNRISGSHSIFALGFVLLLASAVGIMFPFLSYNWFLNSSILFLVMFFIFPALKRNFDKAQVTTGGDFSDTAANIFLNYQNFIIIGFGCGTATALIYNWGSIRAINFLWFLVNIVVLTIFIGMAMKRAFDHQ